LECGNKSALWNVSAEVRVYNVPMAVDRPSRDRLARALAGYLRGEIDNFALDEQVFTSGDRADITLHDVACSLWYFYDDIKSHTVHASPEGWQYLVRCLVFLKTDLESPLASRHFNPHWPAGILALLGILTGIILATILHTAWACLLALVPAGIMLHVIARISSQRRDLEPPSFTPFESESQWLSHQQLLDGERIPAYEPAVHARALRSAAHSTILLIPGMIMMFCVVLPLWALATFIPRRHTRADTTLPFGLFGR
jgi:hypothetical protein